MKTTRHETRIRQAFRPPRLPLLWLVPLLAAGTAAVVFQTAIWFPHVITYGLLFLVLVPKGVAYCLLMVCGSTVADEDAVHNRRVVRTVRIPWGDIDHFQVRPTLFGRAVRVHPKKSSGLSARPVRLAAPRESLLSGRARFDTDVERLTADGSRVRSDPIVATRLLIALPLCLLVVLLLTVDHPWLDPWWPGRHEATGVPSACSVAGDTARRLVPGARPVADQRAPVGVSSCSWTAGTSRLQVSIRLNHRTLGSTGTAEAQQEFARDTSTFLLATPAKVPGLGDEAVRSISSGRPPEARVAARSANVLVEVGYRAGGDGASTGTGATDAARETLRHIQFS